MWAQLCCRELNLRSNVLCVTVRNVQAWPPNELETQTKSNTQPENQAPCQKEGHDTSAAAAPEGTLLHLPVTAEAIDTAAKELIGLLDI